MQPMLLIAHVFMALTLIALILLQHGKGADAGAAFGSGGSSTMFGARGAASFLTRCTAVLAVLFFSNSMGLAYLASRSMDQTSLMDQPMMEFTELTFEEIEGAEPPPRQEDGAENTETSDQAPPASDSAPATDSAPSSATNETPADLPDLPTP